MFRCKNIGEWLNGRATVSKTVGCVFDSRLPCQKQALCACFLFSKKRVVGERVSTQSICSQMLLRLTLHFVPLFKREAPYASRLPCQKQALCACFLFTKKGSTSIHAKAFANKCSPADANFVPLYFVYFRFFA